MKGDCDDDWWFVPRTSWEHYSFSFLLDFLVVFYLTIPHVWSCLQQRSRHDHNVAEYGLRAASPLLSESQERTQFTTPSWQSPFGVRRSTALRISTCVDQWPPWWARDRVRHAEAYARDPREYIAHVLAAYDADPSLSEADSHRYHSYPFVRIFAFSRISTETLKRIEKGANENM